MIESSGIRSACADFSFIFTFSVAAARYWRRWATGLEKICNLVFISRSPFTLLLPHANLSGRQSDGTIGVILASAFSAILVYARNSTW